MEAEAAGDVSGGKTRHLFIFRGSFDGDGYGCAIEAGRTLYIQAREAYMAVCASFGIRIDDGRHLRRRR